MSNNTSVKIVLSDFLQLSSVFFSFLKYQKYRKILQLSVLEYLVNRAFHKFPIQGRIIAQNFARSTLKFILTVTCTIEELKMLSFDLKSIVI